MLILRYQTPMVLLCYFIDPGNLASASSGIVIGFTHKGNYNNLAGSYTMLTFVLSPSTYRDAYVCTYAI